MVEEGLFRTDLYYRLSVLELRIPPLRKRIDDIPLLTRIFLRGLRPDLLDDQIKMISELPIFRSYSWPGNIRELKNYLERFSILLSAEEDPTTLITSLFQVKNINANERLPLAHKEVQLNKAQEAEKLGISRTTLWRRLKNNELGRPSDTKMKHA